MALLIEPVESAKYTKIPIDVIEKWGLVIRSKEVSPKKKTLSYEEIIERTLILPRRYIVLSEISSWFKVPESKFKVIAYHNLASNALTMVEKGLGSLLCIEGSYTNRPRAGLRFLPLSPERTTSHVAVRKKNRKSQSPAKSSGRISNNISRSKNKQKPEQKIRSGPYFLFRRFENRRIFIT